MTLRPTNSATWIGVLAASLMICGTPGDALAHCDTLDGPVVNAARQALETGNVKLVLIWVQKSNEAEITSAFQKTLEVRKLSPAARNLADTFFFETVVRVHRAGEGAPFTGLKPAGTDLGPAVPAADKALETGSVDAVARLLTEDVRHGLEEQFKNVTSKKNFNKDDVAAGQRYVAAYVEYVHYVERIFEASTTAAHGHYPEAASTNAHPEH
jgi:hypothetical protein